jgi:hypothetical protein
MVPSCDVNRKHVNNYGYNRQLSAISLIKCQSGRFCKIIGYNKFQILENEYNRSSAKKINTLLMR